MKNFLNNLKNKTVATFAAVMMTIAAMNAQQVGEQFVFEVTTTAAGQTFRIPLSGRLSQNTTANYTKSYNWNINWGDGSSSQTVSGNQNTNANAGIPHTYAAAGKYTITITPAAGSSLDAWFGAFGFDFNNEGANVQSNRNMVTKVNSPLTPRMTRTQAQIDGANPPHLEWGGIFAQCVNLTMGENFRFAESWDNITRVGNSFAGAMFREITGAGFTMNEVFNLPRGITTVGNSFASSMFIGVTSVAFNMNNVFNLPQGIINGVGTYFAYGMFEGVTSSTFNMNPTFNLPQGITGVGDYFVGRMFSGVTSAAFTMNTVFNLPQGITTVGSSFATQMFESASAPYFNMNEVFNLPQGITTVGTNFARSMFSGVRGAAFKVNDVFKFPALSQTEVNKSLVFDATFRNSDPISNAAQTRTAASIINGNPAPSENRNTFTNNNRFADRQYIATNWGGGNVAPSGLTTITTQPAANTIVAVDRISGSLTAGATIAIAVPVGYQWYSNTVNSNTGGSAIAGATNATFAIPDDLGVGTHYFYCVASAADGAYPTATNVATVLVAADMFVFEVTTTAAGQTFRIPLSGRVNLTDPYINANPNYSKSYNWNIVWGDGSSIQHVSGIQPNNENSDGIPHAYAAPGTYTITITPAGSLDAWFGAFGFSFGTGAAGASENKAMVTKVISPLTPLMTRTQAQIDGTNTNPPFHEWSFTFRGCTNLTMGENFRFAESWDNITRVGRSFAHGMFEDVTNDAFTMNAVFNLPQGITTVENDFAARMFQRASGAAFNMNTVFNLPPGITAVGQHFASNMFEGVASSTFNMNPVFNLPQEITTVSSSFAQNMFQGVSGSAFNMNDVFNLPQKLTTVGASFAWQMFRGVTGNSFKMNDVFNLPPGITTVGSSFVREMFQNVSGAAFKVNDVFKFPALSQTEVNKADVFNSTFRNASALSVTAQTRTAASIINGNPAPSENRNTFFNNNRFADRNYIAPNWGGGNSDPSGLTTITTQPTSSKLFLVGDISGSLTAGATIAIAVPVGYQWYSNTENSNTGGSLIAGATSATFEIPDDFGVGTHYFYCVASSADGAYPTATNVAAVVVAADMFVFEVTTTAAGQTFAIPLSGMLSQDQWEILYKNSYDWNITWGDGSSIQHEEGEQPGNANSAGISHTYASAGTHTVTIAPAGSTDAWLGAFGFDNLFNEQGANAPANRGMITKVNSPLTPQMTRSQAQIDGSAEPPHYEWAWTFMRCDNLTMGDNFRFAESWDNITSVGRSFADGMFQSISGALFTMNDVFNLPQGITSTGLNFAANMFSDVSGAAFNMNAVFNLPTAMTVAARQFAQNMFNGVTGNSFTMGAAFNLPQDITTVDNNFAHQMFANVTSTAFQVNDIFKFPALSQTEVNKSGVFNATFSNIYVISASVQSRTAASIINGNPAPSDNRNTFTNNNRFADRAYIPTRWGGDGTPAITFTAQPESAIVLAGSISGALTVEAEKIPAAASLFDNIAYQWYSNTANSNTGGSAIAGATNATFEIPDDLTLGEHYFYCVASTTDGFYPATTNVAAIVVAPDMFVFEVTTTDAGQTFAIPLSGMLSQTNSVDYTKHYDWHINWGDGSSIQHKEGEQPGDANSAGISHTYASAGTRTVTIAPAGDTDAWLGAFGFNTSLIQQGANANTNRGMITKVNSPLTPQMTRSQAQIDGSAAPPNFEWAWTFMDCVNLTMGDNFRFAESWDNITSVGHGFAQGMFQSVSGASFTMNEVFNLPQGITAVGMYFASQMFSGVSGAAFNMNELFNLPQGITTVPFSFANNMFNGVTGDEFTMNELFNLPPGITTVGDIFASAMFYGVTGDKFTMNTVFNLPQGITTVGIFFASQMFLNASGAAFQVNDVFKFPTLSQTEVDKNSVFDYTFGNFNPISVAVQSRTAASIINGNPVPSDNRNTFTNNNRFADRAYIATNWGGDGTPAITFTAQPVDAIFLAGSISGALTVEAEKVAAASPFDIAYQWYSAPTNANTGGSAIAGDTSATFEIPDDLPLGEHYFYCVAIPSDAAYTAAPSQPAAVVVAPDMFVFEVTTTDAGQTFAIPLSGILSQTTDFDYTKPYNWNITWGDGSGIQHEEGQQSGNVNSDGIPHVYADAGTYTITIAPAGNIEAWFGAFGFDFSSTQGANVQSNRDMITNVNSPLTPQMTRSQTQIDGSDPPPNYEWTYTFARCLNLTMGDNFRFAESWDNITSVGDSFAQGMFNSVSGTSFTMNELFNLPQGIIVAGDGFASNMFIGVSGAEFTMNAVFNLPQGITAAGRFFASSMFEGVTGDKFNMNAVFNLPPEITTVDDYFARSMFYGVTGAAFTMNELFNLPQGIITVGTGFAQSMFQNASGAAFQVNDVFKFPALSQTEVNKYNVFNLTFRNTNPINVTAQSRTAASIINGNPEPSEARYTFFNNNRFADRPYIATNWGGDDDDASALITITAHPAATTVVTHGIISGSLTAEAVINIALPVAYQWYSNTENSAIGGVLIAGATAAEFELPTDLSVGVHYFYCVASTTDGAYPTTTGVATVTVEKRPVAKPSLLALSFEYDGSPKTVELAASSEASFYAITSGSTQTNAGTHAATVSLTDPASLVWDDDDESPSFDLEWTISKATPVYVLPTSLTATYGDLLSSVALPSGWTWDNDDPTATVGTAGSQTHAATFTPEDTDNYNVVTGIDVTIAVKMTYDMTGITFADREVTYNGAPHSIAISGTLPAGVTVTYENNAQTAVGVYTVTAVFATTNANYHTPANMTATLTIKSIPTSSGEMLTANPLRAWTRNGMLHITGLSVGETLSIYTSTGALVHQSKPDSEEMDIPFSVQGVYVVHSGRNTIRVVVQ